MAKTKQEEKLEQLVLLLKQAVGFLQNPDGSLTCRVDIKLEPDGKPVVECGGKRRFISKAVYSQLVGK